MYPGDASVRKPFWAGHCPASAWLSDEGAGSMRDSPIVIARLHPDTFSQADSSRHRTSLNEIGIIDRYPGISDGLGKCLLHCYGFQSVRIRKISAHLLQGAETDSGR